MQTSRNSRGGGAIVVLTGLALTLAGVFGILTAGCSGEGGSGAAASDETLEYTVRGRVLRLPTSPVDGNEIQVHHEAIPEFVRKDGTTGMNAMIMPFPLGPGLTTEGIEPNDVLELDFAVNWARKPHYYVTRIEKLPPDTTLDLN